MTILTRFGWRDLAAIKSVKGLSQRFLNSAISCKSVFTRKMDPLEGCSSKYTGIGEQELEMDWCLSEAGGEDEESLFEARRGEEDGSGGRQGESYRSCALSGLY